MNKFGLIIIIMIKAVHIGTAQDVLKAMLMVTALALQAALTITRVALNVELVVTAMTAEALVVMLTMTSIAPALPGVLMATAVAFK
jgi:hypothetical protein